MATTTTRNRALLVGAVVVLAAVGVALWLFFGGTEPDAVDATTALEQADGASGSDDPSDETATGQQPAAEPSTTDADASAEPDGPSSEQDGTATDSAVGAGDPGTGGSVGVAGQWTVDTGAIDFSREDGTGTFVGFRIEEELSTIGSTEAVGRSPAVAGSLTIEDATVSSASFAGDMAELTTDDPRRDDRARGALGDGTVAFELTEPIDLGEVPDVDETVEVEATGELTINDVTDEVTVPLTASLSESGLLVVTSSFEVALSDHDVEAPSAPIVLSVADVATVEVQLFLSRS